MIEMLAVFEGMCVDKDGLRRLIEMAGEREKWQEAHSLFQEIRHKTLNAERRQDRSAVVQYLFEEICAKTLFNLSYSTAPFDPDSAFWVIPLGVELGRELGFTDPARISSLLRM